MQTPDCYEVRTGPCLSTLRRMTNTGQKQREGLKPLKITKNHLLDILKGGAFAPVGSPNNGPLIQ